MLSAKSLIVAGTTFVFASMVAHVSPSEAAWTVYTGGKCFKTCEHYCPSVGLFKRCLTPYKTRCSKIKCPFGR